MKIYGKDCIITALIYNMPENSHLKGQIVTPFMGDLAGNMKVVVPINLLPVSG